MTAARVVYTHLLDGFRRSATLVPDADALLLGDRRYSFAELSALSDSWAAALTDLVGRRPTRVGVLGTRTLSFYAGVLAALKAGAAFVPLSSSYPILRTGGMIDTADLDAVIAAPSDVPALAAMSASRPLPPVVVPDGRAADLHALRPTRAVGREAVARHERLRTEPEPDPTQPAYLMFTSGSTGLPKAVVVSHANVCAFLDACRDRYDFTGADRFTQTFEPVFDLSVFDLFVAWDAGACVCPLDPLQLLAPRGFLESNAVTVWFSVPSVGSLLRARNALGPGSLPTLRWSLFCGERLGRHLAELWQEAAPNSVLENLYGPTELTIACSAYRWRRSPQHNPAGETVPIGRFFPGNDPLLVRPDGAEASAGEPGELLVAGAQTTVGYWRDPRRTAESYVLRTVGGRTRRFYRTGDVVERHGDDYVHLGRLDEQVKVNGWRIELGEVEIALCRAGAAEAVALACRGPVGDHIEAAVTDADPVQVRRRVEEVLPRYMVPRSIHLLPALPRLGNGKVDRRTVRRVLAEGPEGR